MFIYKIQCITHPSNLSLGQCCWTPSFPKYVIFHLPLNSKSQHCDDSHLEHVAHTPSACWIYETAQPLLLKAIQTYAMQHRIIKTNYFIYNYCSYWFYFGLWLNITWHYFPSPPQKKKLAECHLPNDTWHNLQQKGNVLRLKWHNVDFHAKHSLKDLQIRQKWPHISLEFHLINLYSRFTPAIYTPVKLWWSLLT